MCIKDLRSLLIIALMYLPMQMIGQCSNFVANYPTNTFSTTNSNWQTVTNCAYGGEFQKFNVVQGATYEWTTCYGSGFNTEITLWDLSHSVSLDYSTNDCSGQHGYITWEATYSGEVHLLVSQDACQSNSTCTRVYWRRTIAPPPPVNNTACSPTHLNVTSSCSYTAVTNNGATNSGVANPGCGNYNGGDIWYSATVPASGNLVFSTSAGSVNDAAMAVYSGTCSSPSLIACNDDTNNYMPEITASSLAPGSTVFIRLYSYGNSQQGDFELCVYEPCSVAPANDLRCSAESLVLGSTVIGNNGCATGTSEPPTPSCWTGGDNNSVWYEFTAPASGEVLINTEVISMAATQIALYSGSCSLSAIIDCNLNTGEGCGVSGSSAIQYSGLSSGSDYLIRVDGQEDETGEFNITVNDIDGLSPQSGSDCSNPVGLCSDVISIPDPGPQGTGDFCDFDGANDCTGGERNSLWYEINVGATGDFNFVITPNDGGFSSCGTETDYDFVVWKISGAGTTTDCNGIASNSSNGLLACNYDSRGVTGVGAGGNPPSPYANCFNNSFEPTISATNGDVLLLVVQNYQGSTTGFTLDFTTSDPGVVLLDTPDLVYWNGGADDTWDDAVNWGNCSTIPSCTVDAIVPASAGTHPDLMGEHYVRDLTIETGATMELSSGSILHICGDFVNHGTLLMDETSSLIFDNGNAVQRLTGNFAGSNSIGHLTINKTGGRVDLYSTLEIKGDFLTATTTSWLNTRGNTIYLSGNFRNSNGNSTYRGVGTTGKLIFNGSNEQSFSQGLSNLNLNEVEIDNNGAGVSLLTDMRLKNNTGRLTLTNGILKTNGNKVFIRNPDQSALNAGSSSSYIEGRLQRNVDQTGLFHFPMGHSATGYQLADVTFRSHNFTFITATFNPWSTNPGPLNMYECNALYNMDALDNGYFTLTANASNNVADYDISLYNYAYGNSVGAQGWTVMKDSGSGWELEGDCEVSTAGAVHRTGLNKFSDFATAQASNPLPVELLSFRGQALSNENLLTWSTASEINNEKFTLESSIDAEDFQEINVQDGAGNSSSVNEYQFTDKSPVSDLTYYRLKQTDYNGEFEYSEIIAVQQNQSTLNTLVYPNPVADQLNISALGMGKGVSEIEILDLVGQKIFSQTLRKMNNEHENMVINVENIKSGLYFLQAYNSQGEMVLKEQFIKD